MEGTTLAPMQTSHASARVQQILALLFPSSVMSMAVLVAVVVALLPLLPYLAHIVWELPHLFLLGVVISYGVFSQKNAAAAAAVKAGGDESAKSDGSRAMHGSFASRDGNGAKHGVRAWNSQYHPDDPLVVLADAARDGVEGSGEKPLSLPVRRLKPAAEECGTGDASDGTGEETEFSASTARFDVGKRAVTPSSPSVLDADLSLSSFSPPPLPLLVRRRDNSKSRARSMSDKKPWSFSSKPLTKSKGLASDDSLVCCEVTDREGEVDELDEMIAASERSFCSDGELAADAMDTDEDDDRDKSVDEELLELATKAGRPEEDEVNRKADEFIAKFREQMRLQRFEPVMT